MKGKRHIQSFNEHQENLNISDVSDSLSKIIDDYGGFDDYNIEIDEKRIIVFHSKIGDQHLDEVKEDLINSILEELHREDRGWKLSEQTSKYFMLINYH
jgi:hypothetical protein